MVGKHSYKYSPRNEVQSVIDMYTQKFGYVPIYADTKELFLAFANMETRHASQTKNFKITFSPQSGWRLVWDNMGFVIPYAFAIGVLIMISDFLLVHSKRWFRQMIGA